MDTIPVGNAPFGAFYLFENLEGHHTLDYDVPFDLKQFDISLQDWNGKPVNTNNTNYRLTLRVSYMD
jgi:hypothetical protein